MDAALQLSQRELGRDAALEAFDRVELGELDRHSG
jgi:hypothetical protein